jgi:hypothetical protein
MLIRGQWSACSDGVTRPIILAQILDASGQVVDVRMLVDSAADNTVLSEEVLTNLQLPTQPSPPGLVFQGVGGQSPIVVVTTTLEFPRADAGGTARVRGQFAAFTDPSATDISILGRDVLDHFDVIISRRRDDVLLLAPNHHYTITP